MSINRICSALLAALLATVPALCGAANGVTDKQIVIGASVVLSGPLGAQTAEYGVGSRLYFDAVNAAGGVHGRSIVYKTLDDGFDVKRAVENTRRLLEQDKVFLIYNNTGMAQTAGVRPGIYGFSVVSVDQITRDLGAGARGIVLAQVMPSLAHRSNPAVNEFLTLASAKGRAGPPSQTQFEGFVHARVLVEGLHRAGRDLSTDSFIPALESVGEISFGKFAAHYSPQSHAGSSYVELAIIDNDGKLRY